MKKEEMKISDLYSLENTVAKELLEQFTYPWEVLAHIGDFVERLGETLPKNEYANPASGFTNLPTSHRPQASLRRSSSDRRQKCVTARSSAVKLSLAREQ